MLCFNGIWGEERQLWNQSKGLVISVVRLIVLQLYIHLIRNKNNIIKPVEKPINCLCFIKLFDFLMYKFLVNVCAVDKQLVLPK